MNLRVKKRFFFSICNPSYNPYGKFKLKKDSKGYNTWFMNLLALSIFFFVLFLDILKSIYLQLEWKWILMTILLKKIQKKKREYFKIQGSIRKFLNNKNWSRNFLSMQSFHTVMRQYLLHFLWMGSNFVFNDNSRIDSKNRY